MNKKGFISVYALLLLLVFLGFATMFAQQIKTFAFVAKPQAHEQLDLFILHKAKNYLKKLEEDEVSKEESVERGEEQTVLDEESEDPELKTSEQAVYNDCTIQMDQGDEGQLHIDVSCSDMRSSILLTYDVKQKYIISYVYE